MTHSDFVAGIREGTLECWVAEPYGLGRGPGKWAFSLLWLIYAIGPIVFVPLWAHHASDLWLLAGVPVAYLFVFSAAQHSRLVFYVACYWAGFATHSGLSGFHRATFYFLCAVCGYGLWQLAEAVALGCARASLLDNCQLYESALAKGRLRVIRLDSMQQPVLTPDDITAASSGFVPLKRFPVLLVLTNIVMETLTYLLGFFTGLAATAIAHLRGIAGLRPERADLIMRQLKKGTVGLLASGLGYVGIYSIWGLLAVLLYVLAVVLLALKQRRVPVAGS